VRLLAALEFEALATVDGEVTRDEAIDHCRALCAAVSLPVSADLENCFAHDPK
jgi:2-methylisocitrate lyase-like PEP mutase family enzyme